MIPPPPPDAALPGLATAFSAEAMRDILGRRLIAGAADQLRLESCRPCYVRYKPGTNCLVQYELSVRDGATGALHRTTAQVHLYGDDLASAIAARRSLARLVEQAARSLPELPLAGSAHLPELPAVAQVYPVDRALPALVQALSPDNISEQLRQALGDELRWTLARQPPELIRYKPGRKAMLRYRTREREPGALYGKLLWDLRGAALLTAGHVLVRAEVATPAPLAYLPDLRMLVHPAVPGTPLSAIGDGDRLTAWMGQVAHALGRLHATRLDGLSIPTPSDEAGMVMTAGASLGRLVPGRTRDIDRLASMLATDLRDVPPAESIVHGDFYDDQVLVSGSRATLIDLDELRLGHPLVDVGNFLAHLTARSTDGRADVEHAHAAFLDAYARRYPRTRERIALFEAAALLKLAVRPFRSLQPDWPEAIERLSDLAERRFREHRRSRPVPAPKASTDPALPQLARLRAPALMAGALEQAVYKEPVRVRAITVVRHKPGRRCILRYDLWVGPPEHRRPERLWGKTFASDRGPRVHEIIRTIADARACGPVVCLPEPVGYLPGFKLVLQRDVPGTPITGRLLAGDTELVTRLADALHAFHSSGLDLGRRHGIDNELDPLAARVERLCAVAPALAAAARRCFALVERGRCLRWGWRWQPVHRDFYHDQVLADDHGLSLLDFDDAALSEPAVDVANFLAHLYLLSLQQGSPRHEIADVAAAFRDRYLWLDRGVDRSLLRFLEGATLLRLAEIHVPRGRGVVVATALLARSEFLLIQTQDKPVLEEDRELIV